CPKASPQPCAVPALQTALQPASIDHKGGTRRPTCYLLPTSSSRDRGLAPALATQQPTAPVGAHVLDQRNKRATLVGQCVLDPRWDLRVGAALNDALVLERPQAKRKRARADPIERPLQLTEALTSVGQVANHEEGPLAGDDLRATTHWTGILSHRL